MLEITFNKKTSSEKAGDNVQSSQSTKESQTPKTNFSQVDFDLIAPNEKNRVLARNLYKFLELAPAVVGRWLNSKIVNNKFAIENEDFWGFNILVEGNEIQDFELTPNFAKKLAMMSKSKNGEKVRDYFLEMEKIAQEKLKEHPRFDLPNNYEEAVEKLLLEIKARNKLALEHQAQKIELEHKQSIILEKVSQVPPKTMRAKINEICRYTNQNDFQSRWRNLYHEFLYTYKLNLKERSENSGIKSKTTVTKNGYKFDKITYKKSPLDIAEEIGQLENLYNLALKLFETQRENGEHLILN